MPYRPILLVSLYLLISVCIGAPPGETGETSKSTNNRYTDQEDQFIVDELSRIGQKYPYIPVSGKHVWAEVELTHREKWKKGTYGFPQERSLSSLRSRFIDILVNNYAETNVKVPETLRQKFVNSERKHTVYRHPYKKEEDDFIIEELLKPSYKKPLNIQLCKRIREEHNKRHEANAHGFEKERSHHSIRSRILTMRDAGQLPNAVVDKFQMHNRGAAGSSSEALHLSADCDLESIEEEESALMAGLIENFLEDKETGPSNDPGTRCRYTEKEEEFIINQLLSLCNDDTRIRDITLWGKIAENLRANWKASTSGFPRERSVPSIYNHFVHIMIPHSEKVPEALLQKFHNQQPGNKGKGNKYSYSKEENALIIEALLKSSCTTMFGSSTMEKIQAELAKKRHGKIPGFENVRTVSSLRAHLINMKKNGVLPAAIMEKIWKNPSGASSSGSSKQRKQNAEMIHELKHANCDVDFGILDQMDEE